jgi:hypothetical protein
MSSHVYVRASCDCVRQWVVPLQSERCIGNVLSEARESALYLQHACMCDSPPSLHRWNGNYRSILYERRMVSSRVCVRVPPATIVQAMCVAAKALLRHESGRCIVHESGRCTDKAVVHHGSCLSV